MFSIAVSGLKAANADLGVTSNNISNVASTGFKSSRAEFADIYSSSVLGNSRTAVGGGTLLTNVRQSFQQGTLEYTDSSLDMAIRGQGFFAISGQKDRPDLSYTRSGAFNLDAEGYVTTSGGDYLQSFPVDEISGDILSTAGSSLQPILINDVYGSPSASSTVNVGANLPADAADVTLTFDPNDPDTYSKTTSTQVFDSLGNGHTLQIYFVKTDSASNQWQTHSYLDGSQMNIASGFTETITFGSDGTIGTPSNGDLVFDPVTLSNGAEPMGITLDLKNDTGGVSQFSAPFYVSQLSHDGAGTGRLSGLEIDGDGLIQAKYTNGRSRYMGKIAMTDFTSEFGLRQIGNTSWTESAESGEARHSEANTGRLGSIDSSALESSNVDLTNELVQLIRAQRNFQANAKSIETGNTLTQTIIQL